MCLCLCVCVCVCVCVCACVCVCVSVWRALARSYMRACVVCACACVCVCSVDDSTSYQGHPQVVTAANSLKAFASVLISRAYRHLKRCAFSFLFFSKQCAVRIVNICRSVLHIIETRFVSGFVCATYDSDQHA